MSLQIKINGKLICVFTSHQIKFVIKKQISEQIGHPGILPFNIFADVEYDTSEEVKYKRKPNRQKR